MSLRFAKLTNSIRLKRVARAIVLAAIALSACSKPQQGVNARRPADVRAQIVRLLPIGVTDRQGWATDIYAAFAALRLEPSTRNICATLAVADQESNFHADPEVQNLPNIARAEIYRRAEQHHLPALIVRGALLLKSPNGKTYDQRLDSARTEQDLSRIYEDLIGAIPLGKRLFAGENPIHTAGPMQVSVAFAEQQAREHGYPYPIEGSIRHELFTRRGGVYFGVAHLLGFPAPYTRPLYRFADYNAGWYASRNAAFQKAVVYASGIPIALDGDLVRFDKGHVSNEVSATEIAVRSLSNQLGLSNSQIRRALERGNDIDFEQTTLYKSVFALAQRIERRTLPREAMPQIALEGPKITRKLTTQWYATRVDKRYQSCLAKRSRP